LEKQDFGKIPTYLSKIQKQVHEEYERIKESNKRSAEEEAKKK